MASGALGAQTLQEILSQPAVWRSVATVLPDWRRIPPAFDPPPAAILFTGCGSSYYAAQAAAAVFQRVTHIPSSAVPASELLLYPELTPGTGRPPLLIAISRSGTTSETVAATSAARRRDVRVLSVVCDATSALAQASDHVLAFPAAQEQGLVMTRSFTTMLLGLQHCAGMLAGDDDYLSDLATLSEAGTRLASALVGMDSPWSQLVVLGGGPLFGLAQEAAMKVREASLTDAIAYHPLEFRHGPTAVIDEHTLVLLLATESARPEEAALVQDVQALGARVVAIADCADGLPADAIVELRSGVVEYARQVLFMLPIHLLAYQRAVAKGIDPDVPRNLSRAVILNGLQADGATRR
ncbi:MAG: SIS domain-containing protein [Chloroflexota bacterium]